MLMINAMQSRRDSKHLEVTTALRISVNTESGAVNDVGTCKYVVPLPSNMYVSLSVLKQVRQPSPQPRRMSR